MKCGACKGAIGPTEDHYRDHAKRTVCKACYRRWAEAKR